MQIGIDRQEKNDCFLNRHIHHVHDAIAPIEVLVVANWRLPSLDKSR
jgi:hypothetical protein